MTDITELAKAAEKYRSTLEAHRNNPRDGVALNAWDDATSKFMELVDNDELNIISGLLEALEKAKGMEAYWKTQCRGITDHCEELQARIAELESRTVTATVTAAAADVLAERKRQVTTEGWTPEHDDQHVNFEMAIAGGLYAISAVDSHHKLRNSAPSAWPWDRKWWKPDGPRRDLVKAGALILAEIERLDRAAGIKVEAE
ncbi:TPA: hypothetical protein L9K38_002950 [Klebsiella pneumoniae]|nr:hypothetical protein [Klebsiella pneumoniae]